MITALYNTPALLLTLTTMMWGLNAVMGQLVVGEITPLALVFLRWFAVALVLLPLCRRQIRAAWPVVKTKPVITVLSALIGFTCFNTLFYMASVHTTAINIGILQGSIPVFVLTAAFFAYGEKITPGQAIGVLVTMTGVLVVASKGEWARLMGLSFNPGDIVMLIACGCYSAYAVMLRKRPPIPGIALFAMFSLIAAVSSAPLAFWEAAQPGYAWPTGYGILLTIIVAIFPSCLAQIFFLRGVDLIGPGRAGVYANLVPVFAAILSVLILGEAFALYHAAAMVLVLSGIVIAQRVARPASKNT